jgi:MFS family permease
LQEQETESGFKNALRVLRFRNYRVYTIGNSISQVGIWIQRIAVGWLAWQLTHSGFWLGMCAAGDLVPSIVISPFAGALADRVNKVTLIQISMVLGMIQSWALAILTFMGIIDVWMLFGLTVALGTINALNQPARLAIIPNLVGPDSLGSAVAINSLIFNIARFIGPATAGFVIAEGNIGLAFTLNALTYVAFIYSVWLVDAPDDRRPIIGKSHFWRDLGGGYGYALRDPGIGKMFILLIITTVGIRGFVEMFPGFADEVFDRGPKGLAFLTATVGLGAVVGGLYMLRRNSLKGLATLVIRATLVMSLGLVAFAWTSTYWLALFFVFFVGIAMCATGIGAQTLIQTSTTPAMRGRVMGFYGMIFRAGPSMNALLLGGFSERFGMQWPVVGGACVCLLGWLWIRTHQSAIEHALEEDASRVAAQGAPAQ